MGVGARGASVRRETSPCARPDGEGRACCCFPYSRDGSPRTCGEEGGPGDGSDDRSRAAGLPACLEAGRQLVTRKRSVMSEKRPKVCIDRVIPRELREKARQLAAAENP